MRSGSVMNEPSDPSVAMPRPIDAAKALRRKKRNVSYINTADDTLLIYIYLRQ